jgi:H/ACA ribonucleoprotein complex subunit 3
MLHILKCQEGHYTVENECPKCGAKAILPKPPKFGLQDKYSEYRRKIKKEELKKRNLF